MVQVKKTPIDYTVCVIDEEGKKYRKTFSLDYPRMKAINEAVNRKRNRKYIDVTKIRKIMVSENYK